MSIWPTPLPLHKLNCESHPNTLSCNYPCYSVMTVRWKIFYHQQKSPMKIWRNFSNNFRTYLSIRGSAENSPPSHKQFFSKTARLASRLVQFAPVIINLTALEQARSTLGLGNCDSFCDLQVWVSFYSYLFTYCTEHPYELPRLKVRTFIPFYSP